MSEKWPLPGSPKKGEKGTFWEKVSWSDLYGNSHDLDFVIERDGSDHINGRPVAFIESAWRRYTKHSRNKAQEIQGAILPLAERYKWNNPFLGAILAGIFTEGSIEQLASLGFHVLYFPYETFITAFKSEGIDIEFNESTPDSVYRERSEQIEQADSAVMERIKLKLIKANQGAIDEFFNVLQLRLGRNITKVIVIPLYGRGNEFSTIEEAISFLDRHSIYEGSGEFRKYEIHIEFSNGDRVDASFESPNKVKEFLEFVASQ